MLPSHLSPVGEALPVTAKARHPRSADLDPAPGTQLKLCPYEWGIAQLRCARRRLPTRVPYPSPLWKSGARFSRKAVTASLNCGRAWARANSRISSAITSR